MYDEEKIFAAGMYPVRRYSISQSGQVSQQVTEFESSTSASTSLRTRRVHNVRQHLNTPRLPPPLSLSPPTAVTTTLRRFGGDVLLAGSRPNTASVAGRSPSRDPAAAVTPPCQRHGPTQRGPTRHGTTRRVAARPGAVCSADRRRSHKHEPRHGAAAVVVPCSWPAAGRRAPAVWAWTLSGLRPSDLVTVPELHRQIQRQKTKLHPL